MKNTDSEIGKYVSVPAAFDILREAGAGRSLVAIYAAMKRGVLRTETYRDRKVILRKDLEQWATSIRRKNNERERRKRELGID